MKPAERLSAALTSVSTTGPSSEAHGDVRAVSGAIASQPTTAPSSLDPDALYVAVDRARRQRNIRHRDVAREAGISASTLTRIGQGRRPDVDGLVRLLAWLGTTDVAPYLTRQETP